MWESHGYQITGIQLQKVQIRYRNWTPTRLCANHMSNRDAENQLGSKILL